MIETITCYRVRCDGCTNFMQHEDAEALFYGRDEAHRAASCEDWETAGVTSNRVLCPKCVCARDGHPPTAIRYGQCTVCDALVTTTTTEAAR